MLQISIFSFSDHIETALTTNICIYLYGHQKIVYSWGFLAATNRWQCFTYPAVSIANIEILLCFVFVFLVKEIILTFIVKFVISPKQFQTESFTGSRISHLVQHRQKWRSLLLRRREPCDEKSCYDVDRKLGHPAGQSLPISFARHSPHFPGNEHERNSPQ